MLFKQFAYLTLIQASLNQKNMKKKQAASSDVTLSNELIVDEQGRLRVLRPQSEKKALSWWQFYSSNFLFLSCGIFTIFLIDVLVSIFAISLKQQYLMHNPEAQSAFYPFLAIVLISITGSLGLLLFVIYKINVPYLQKAEVLVEIDPES